MIAGILIPPRRCPCDNVVGILDTVAGINADLDTVAGGSFVYGALRTASHHSNTGWLSRRPSTARNGWDGDDPRSFVWRRRARLRRHPSEPPPSPGSLMPGDGDPPSRGSWRRRQPPSLSVARDGGVAACGLRRRHLVPVRRGTVLSIALFTLRVVSEKKCSLDGF